MEFFPHLLNIKYKTLKNKIKITLLFSYYNIFDVITKK